MKYMYITNKQLYFCRSLLNLRVTLMYGKTGIKWNWNRIWSYRGSYYLQVVINSCTCTDIIEGHKLSIKNILVKFLVMIGPSKPLLSQSESFQHLRNLLKPFWKRKDKPALLCETRSLMLYIRSFVTALLRSCVCMLICMVLDGEVISTFTAGI